MHEDRWQWKWAWRADLYLSWQDVFFVFFGQVGSRSMSQGWICKNTQDQAIIDSLPTTVTVGLVCIYAVESRFIKIGDMFIYRSTVLPTKKTFFWTHGCHTVMWTPSWKTSWYHLQISKLHFVSSPTSSLPPPCRRDNPGWASHHWQEPTIEVGCCLILPGCLEAGVWQAAFKIQLFDIWGRENVENPVNLTRSSWETIRMQDAWNIHTSFMKYAIWNTKKAWSCCEMAMMSHHKKTYKNHIHLNAPNSLAPSPVLVWSLATPGHQRWSQNNVTLQARKTWVAEAGRAGQLKL